MTQLNAAETKFFESRGADVDTSLTSGSEPAPSEPSSTPAPAAPASAAPTQGAPQPLATPPDPAAAPSAAAQPDTTRQVPIEALHAERRQRQQMEQEFRQLREQFQQVQQYLQQASQPPDERPDPQQDPYGALEYDNRKLREQVEQVSQWRTQQEQGQRQQQQVQRLTQHLTQAEQQFATTQADYFQAADYAIKREDLRLSAFYPDPQMRQQMLRQEIANLVAQAIQNGANPAQMIYQHAINMGYARPAAPGGMPPAGGAAPGAPPEPPAAPPSVPEAMATIQRGLEQQTRSGSGGSTPPSELTPQMLLAMDGEEFQKNWNKAFKKH